MGTAWYTQLGISHDPFSPEPAQGPWIFETPVVTGYLNTLVNIAATGAFIGLVKGQRGAGKTTLLNRLCDRLRDRPDMDVVRLTWTREKALAEAVGHSVGLENTARLTAEPSQCLREHLGRLRTGGLTIVIAIDEAHQLTSKELALLLELSLAPNPDENGALHTLLFAEPSIEAQLKAIPGPLPMDRIYTLNLAPLSSEQTSAYLAHRLQAAGFPRNLPLPRLALGLIQRRAGGVPLAINREAGRWLPLYSNPARRWIPPPFRRLTPWQRIVAGLTLAGVIAVGLGIWLLSQETSQTRPPEAMQDAAKPTAAAAALPSTTVLPSAAETPRQSTPTSADAQPSQTDSSLADTPLADQATMGGSDAPPIAILPQPLFQEMPDGPTNDDLAAASDTFSAEEPPLSALEPLEPLTNLIDISPPADAPPLAPTPFAEQQPTNETTTVQQAEPPAVEEAKTAEATDSPLSEPVAETQAAQPPDVEEATIAKATDSPLSEPVKEVTEAAYPLSGVHRDAWFQQREAEEYFIQLMAVGNERALRDFILARQPFPAEPGYFRAYSQGREWFVLVLGPYPNRQSAQTALQTLPPGLRRYQPWPRSLASIQAAMNAYAEHTQ